MGPVRLTVDVRQVLASVPATAWRNGAGSTRTVASGGGPDRHWRVSVATVTDGAVFSAYPGLDRVLLPLGPDGVRLVGPAGPLLAGDDGTFRFDGGLPVTAIVTGADPVTVLNVMTTSGTHRIRTTPHDGTVVVHLEPQETP